ncbi:hypothetical protein SAMN05421805_101909 [Saccharopolyspora antimicrobica]|uniref:AAA domain-containing protein n=1 Tax=Saccharopolyspora antimicrobica TaxID=455193 RepID=A0A1I4SA60_9PSEU|nr:hypothetical protein [Saccharopolyspora antimicrobica]RKT87659.1 hypothetical protein ATL45_6079 [Saccharopolyspora antimicrobica]SFM61369.1 hypothetical protein SAMN05421805_101909 [Saccharopolyspora antimicrobica]
MIVVVEGPSAAGKTTWCRRRFPDHVVDEYQPTGSEPVGDPAAQASYWSEVNAGRWVAALGREQETGLAVCDSDPLKLHYSWCLAAIGEGPAARFRAEAVAVRAAVAEKRLGLADLVLVTLPPLPVLRRQRDGDPSRRRRHFDLHARLSEPLRQWYRAWATVSPGRVVWHLPATELPRPGKRSDRYDLAVFDGLFDALPRLP